MQDKVWLSKKPSLVFTARKVNIFFDWKLWDMNTRPPLSPLCWNKGLCKPVKMEPTPAYIPWHYGFYRSPWLGLSYPASSRFSSPLTSKVDSSLKALALRSSEQESVKILELKIDSYIGNLERYIFTPSPFPSFISKKIESIEEVLKTLTELSLKLVLPDS